VIIGIDPASTNISGRIRHGSMINPNPTDNNQGYDSSVPTWNNDYNVARPGGNDLTLENNLSIDVNSSLISTISIIATGQRP